jgi:hypothetical protein
MVQQFGEERRGKQRGEAAVCRGGDAGVVAVRGKRGRAGEMGRGGCCAGRGNRPEVGEDSDHWAPLVRKKRKK